MQNNRISDIELLSALNDIKKTYKRAFPFIFVFIGLIILSISFTLSKDKATPELYLITIILTSISIIAIIAIFCIRASAVKNMKMFFAETLINNYLSKTFETYTYNPTARLDDHILTRQMYNKSGRIDKIKGSDYIKATYKGLNLEMSDISLIEVKVTIDSKGNRRERQRTFFKGLWCVCDLKKTLESDLWITEKSSFFNLNFGNVDTDNEAFNKRFAVITKTPVEAFYVLTPHMMEYIESMDSKAKGEIYLSFSKEGKLYIAINSTRDSFEFGFNCDISKAKQIIEKDLNYIINFIDELISSPYYRKR